MHHSQQRTGTAVSEFFSSDVLHLILGSPTNTLQALDGANSLPEDFASNLNRGH